MAEVKRDVLEQRVEPDGRQNSWLRAVPGSQSEVAVDALHAARRVRRFKQRDLSAP